MRSWSRRLLAIVLLILWAAPCASALIVGLHVVLDHHGHDGHHEHAGTPATPPDHDHGSDHVDAGAVFGEVVLGSGVEHEHHHHQLTHDHQHALVVDRAPAVVSTFGAVATVARGHLPHVFDPSPWSGAPPLADRSRKIPLFRSNCSLLL